MARGFVVAIVGAESTGKTTLASDLGTALRAQGKSVAIVGEYLREFCDEHRRTPLPAEQAAIAAEQTRRIEVAAEDARDGHRRHHRADDRRLQRLPVR